MKLLSVAMPQHDVNISYADAGTVHYVKLERPKQEKRYHFASLQDWRAEVQALWGDAATRPDDAIFSFDPGAVPPALRPLLGQGLLQRVAAGSRAERLPAPLCQFLGVDRAWFASHHYCLLYTSPSPRDGQKSRMPSSA